MRVIIASLLKAASARDKTLIEAVRRIRAQHGDAEIDLIALGVFPQRWQAAADISHVHILREDLNGFELFFPLVKILRAGRYDLAISVYESFVMQLALLFSLIREKYQVSGEKYIRLDLGEVLLRNNVIFASAGEEEKVLRQTGRKILKALIIIYGILFLSVLIIYWGIKNRVNG